MSSTPAHIIRASRTATRSALKSTSSFATLRPLCSASSRDPLQNFSHRSSVSRPSSCSRSFSTNRVLLTDDSAAAMPATAGVTIERHGAYGVISIAFEPVNAMTREAWQGVLDALTTLESDPACHGVILRSGLKKRNVFSAGVALTEFYAPETDIGRFKEFWLLFQSVIGRVYSSRLITVAAVNGFSPAGGTGLTLGCDIRIATQDVSLGLNEVALGIPVPLTWTKLMAARIGQGKAADLCVFAKPVRADEALACGLVHQIVPDDSTLLQVAQESLSAALKLPQAARTRTKSFFTGDLATQMLDSTYLSKEADEYWEYFRSDTTTGIIGKMLKRTPPKGKL